MLFPTARLTSAIAFLAIVCCDARAIAGVPTTTIITHGFTLGEKGVWVQGMAEAIIARAGEGYIYRYTGASGHLALVASSGAAPQQNVVVIFNWTAESAGVSAGPNWRYAEAAGDALAGLLRNPIYAQPGAGPDDLATNRIVHFIGHSRGACVNSEATRRLAAAGLPVDQMTMHDPHPVNGTLDAPYDQDWGDPLPGVWPNISWADNYWRADGGGLFNGLDFDGIPISGAFNTMLSESALNCCAYGFAHSDVHLWYHGTIDLAPTPCDGEQCITAQMRATWWPEGFAERGYFYAALGGGAALRPAPSAGGAALVPPPVIFNGDFDRGSFAGWSYHGGAITGQMLTEGSNGYVRLAAPGGGAQALHNRFALPADAEHVLMRYRVMSASGAAMLRISLVDVEAATTITIGELPLAPAAGGGWLDSSVAIPTSLQRARMSQLKLELVAPAPATAVLDIDDIDIALAPPCPADVNDDGIVGVADLLAVIAAWGPCPPLPQECPQDVDGDDSVGVSDLLSVISGWGPCK